MAQYEIGKGTAEEIGAFYMQHGEHIVLRVDGTAVAYAAVCKDGDRTWGMLNVADGVGDHGLRVVRAIQRFLRDRNETTYVVCGFPDRPKAGRLMTILGFAPTEEKAGNGKTIWRWRAAEWR